MTKIESQPIKNPNSAIRRPWSKILSEPEKQKLLERSRIVRKEHLIQRENNRTTELSALKEKYGAPIVEIYKRNRDD